MKTRTIRALALLLTPLLCVFAAPARAAVDPFIHFFRFIPALALTSLFILWFGIGEASKVNLVVYAVMFIVLVSTASGAASAGTT